MVKKHFPTVTVENSISMVSYDVSEELKDVPDIVDTYAPQGPTPYQSRKAKIEYLCSAAITVPRTENFFYSMLRIQSPTGILSTVCFFKHTIATKATSF